MEILEQYDDHMVVKTQVSYDNEILNTVKQWIPYIYILKPKELDKKLMNILKNYIKY